MDSFGPVWIYFVVIWGSVQGDTATNNAPSSVTPIPDNTTLAPNSSDTATNYTIEKTTSSNFNVSNTTMATSNNTDVVNSTTTTMHGNETAVNTTTMVTTSAMIVNSTTDVPDNMTYVTVIDSNATTSPPANRSTNAAATAVPAQDSFPTELVACIAGSICGFTIAVIVIAIVCHKIRSNRSMGKRYHVESRAFLDSVVIPEESKDIEVANDQLQRKSDGNQNYHVIDEETFLSNRQEKGSSDLTETEEINRKEDAKPPDKEEDDNRTSDSGIDIRLDDKTAVFKSRTPEKIEGDENRYIKRDGDTEHVYTKSVKRGNTTKAENSSSVDIESKEKSTQNSQNQDINSTQESHMANGNEDVEEDDVYVNAYSAPSSDSMKQVNSDACIEALRSAITTTNNDNDDLYDIALPIDEDEQSKENEKSKSEITNANDKKKEADDHYEISEETPDTKNRIQGVSDDAIYHNEQDGDDDAIYHNEEIDIGKTSREKSDDDDDDIYHNEEMDISKTSHENSDEDTYDCAMSTISHEKNASDIYDSTLDSEYDITHHQSEKRRFFIRPSKDDNYDHCELPTEREDYDIVELPEEN